MLKTYRGYKSHYDNRRIKVSTHEMLFQRAALHRHKHFAQPYATQLFVERFLLQTLSSLLAKISALYTNVQQNMSTCNMAASSLQANDVTALGWSNH